MPLQILEITAPVFCLAAIGYLWALRGIPYDMAFATRLGVRLAMPCLIFSTLAEAEIDPAAIQTFLGASVLLYVGFGLLFAAGIALAGLRQRTFLPPTVFNNTGNLGLPIAFFAYGEEGLALAMVLFAAMVVMQFSLGVWFVAGPGKSAEALRQPLVWGALAGVLVSLFGYEAPQVVSDTLRLIGQIGIPLMVLTLGVSISQIAVSGVTRAVVIALVRYVAAGGLAVGVALALDLQGAAFGVLILMAVMPAPVTNYLIALEYDAEPEEVAALVVISTLLSVALIPLTLLLLL